MTKLDTDSNIASMISEYEDEHPCEVNVKHRRLLKELIHSRADYLRGRIDRVMPSSGRLMYPFISRTGQLQMFDHFTSTGEGSNMVVVGFPGSGKSFLVKDIITHHLSSNTKVMVVDFGRNHENLTNLIGGQIIEFGGSSFKPCFNPFTKAVIKVDENDNPMLDADGRKQLDEDEIVCISQIVGMMLETNFAASRDANTDTGGDEQDGYKQAIVREAVKIAFQRMQTGAGIKDVYGLIVEKYDNMLKVLIRDHSHEATMAQMIEALSQYGHPDGSNYSYFNGTNNINFESDFLTIELDSLRSKGDLFYIAYMVLLNQAVAEFRLINNKKKVLILEEVWCVLDNDIIVCFLEYLCKCAKKNNGAVIMSTNSLLDFGRSSKTKAIYETATWKFLLEMELKSLDDAMDNGILHLNESEKELLLSVRRTSNYVEVFVDDSKSVSVSRVCVDPNSQILYANHPADTAKVNLAHPR